MERQVPCGTASSVHKMITAASMHSMFSQSHNNHRASLDSIWIAPWASSAALHVLATFVSLFVAHAGASLPCLSQPLAKEKKLTARLLRREKSNSRSRRSVAKITDSTGDDVGASPRHRDRGALVFCASRHQVEVSNLRFFCLKSRKMSAQSFF